MTHKQATELPIPSAFDAPVIVLEKDSKQESLMLRSRLTMSEPDSVPACVIVLASMSGEIHITALAKWSAE